MFSIINTGMVRVLVWYSPGPRTISTLAPRSVAPAHEPRAIPDPSLILPWSVPHEARPTSPMAPGSSHTPASSSVGECSHTQEFMRSEQTKHYRER
jgi:hypothetical protein